MGLPLPNSKPTHHISFFIVIQKAKDNGTKVWIRGGFVAQLLIVICILYDTTPSITADIKYMLKGIFETIRTYTWMPVSPQILRQSEAVKTFHLNTSIIPINNLESMNRIYWYTTLTPVSSFTSLIAASLIFSPCRLRSSFNIR